MLPFLKNEVDFYWILTPCPEHSRSNFFYHYMFSTIHLIKIELRYLMILEKVKCV